MLLAAALPASAQPAERQPWWKAATIQNAISLTSHQAEQLDAIYRESLPERRSLRRQLAAQQKRVEKMFAGGPFDDEHVRPVIHRLFAIEKQRNVARVLMLVRMYRVLTPIQRDKLEDLSAQRPGAAVPNLFAGLSSGKE
jgi:Spy/CpxP family protein refolding chaperone